MAKIFVNMSASVYIILVMIIGFGAMSYMVLPREAEPDIQIPLLIVTVPFPGGSPEDVETLVVNKVERKLKGVEDVKKISSLSSVGAATITMEFQTGTDIDEARRNVREAMDQVERELPDDIEDTIISEINFSETPILFISISGDQGLVELKRIADDIDDELDALTDILSTSIAGGLEREIRVDVNPEKLIFYSVSLDQISQAISNENSNIPGGTLEVGPLKYLIRVPGEFDKPSEIEDIIIIYRGDSPVYLKDVATVRDTFKDRSSYSRVDHLESVSISVSKRTGRNLLELRNDIFNIVDKYKNIYPDVQFKILSDKGEFVLSLLTDLENNIITGFLFVFAVLLIFMGFRNALLVATAVPLSFLLGIILMDNIGYTMNFIVIFSLILSLGLLVDNSIVVIENIYRHRQSGSDAATAAIVGTNEVALPVFTSCLTTLVAFIPIMFLPGIIGEFMSYLPKTVVITLSASLFVALVINPVMCRTFMKVPASQYMPDADDLKIVERSRFLRFYRSTLLFCLRRPIAVLIGVIVIFVCVIALYANTTLPKRGTEFFPSGEPEWGKLDIEVPLGSKTEVTNDYMQQIESIVLNYEKFAESVVVNVGSGESNSGSGASNKGYIRIDFPDWRDWIEKPSTTLENIYDDLSNIPGIKVTMEKAERGPPTGEPINIEVVGNNLDVVLPFVDRLKESISAVPDLINLDDNFDRTRPSVLVTIDREKAARLGLRTSEISRTIRAAFVGSKASEFRDIEDDYDIVVRMDPEHRLDPDYLKKLYISTRNNTQVPISDVASIKFEPSIGSIRHSELDRVITVSADVTAGISGVQKLNEVRRAIAEIEIPQGVSLRYTGENEDVEESQSFLLKAFFIALFLIFLILVTQFNAFSIPFIILTSVGLSLMGIFIGLMIHDRPFSIMMGGIGAISLAGIAVNNAIVLLDFVRQLRTRGYDTIDAITYAGMVRLRPVLLTASTTILGLIPVAMGLDINFFRWPVVALGGESSSFWVPMSLAVIYGLLVTTPLTLIVVPTCYYLHERTMLKINSLFARIFKRKS